MRQGFDQLCPDCFYASYVNMVYGKCYCGRLRMIVSRARFPPVAMKSQVPGICDFFRNKSP